MPEVTVVFQKIGPLLVERGHVLGLHNYFDASLKVGLWWTAKPTGQGTAGGVDFGIGQL